MEKELKDCGTMKLDKKVYSTSTRLKVFDCIVNKVPTANIPVLIKQFEKRIGSDPEEILLS